VQTDVIARYRKAKGYSVSLTTGSDENSLTNVLAAEKLGIGVRELCDANSLLFRSMADRIGLSYDAFVRTSADKDHAAVAEAIWGRCSKSGDIYRKKYKGLYCVRCELYYTESELVAGLCPEHKVKPEVVEEENYFFRLSRYQDRILELVEKGTVRITPDGRKNEVLSFVKSGLEDFSISRSVKRAHGWGIPVPGDPSQIIYVWFDALGTYLTGAGMPSDMKRFGKLWPADVHVIGKGIARFHAVYWLAMLISAGLELPREIFIHGYVTIEGQKMSKSIGNVVDPIDMIEKYGADPLRYYLIKNVSTFEDGDFSEKALREAINSELVGNLGNFVNRTLTFISSKLDGKIEEQELGEGALAMKNVAGLVDDVDALLADGQLNAALLKVMEISGMGNKYFQDSEPWKLVKEGDGPAAREVLFVCANICRILGIVAWPFMPAASEKLLGYVGCGTHNFAQARKLVKKFAVVRPQILFSKVE
jgi:methionyl-tRNA synthetase